jgi:hypothetical protein
VPAEPNRVRGDRGSLDTVIKLLSAERAEDPIKGCLPALQDGSVRFDRSDAQAAPRNPQAFAA